MELKKVLVSKRMVIGRNKTLALLKAGEIAEVIIAKNYPAHFRKDIESLAAVAGVKVTISDGNSDELGAMCKKPFTVAVIGVKARAGQ